MILKDRQKKIFIGLLFVSGILLVAGIWYALFIRGEMPEVVPGSDSKVVPGPDSKNFSPGPDSKDSILGIPVPPLDGDLERTRIVDPSLYPPIGAEGGLPMPVPPPPSP